MTTRQYLAALKKLGLGTHSNVTKRHLGVSQRQLAYMATGRAIPEYVAILLGMYLVHGLPSDDA